MDLINMLLAIVTIGFGTAGWLAPAWTMEKVGLADTGSTMGYSEIRAASGALFVVAGLATLFLASPISYAMLGFVWLGGALGRVTSLLMDGTTARKWTFFGTEIVVGLMLVLGNLWLA
ncbi:DUF4345 family protein [Jannaschia seohaensis]|uniref:Uncharacterized protein DUF4345 n=1 Tax=Jannaschia seohaensis TaxID=475081 RepID=A0A2Y9AKN0_9RHOB|nr:DUF4345 family protein [Jannaschia seohaensis]PWJ20510.1 uncharacterized protein DUF4345 [Jannaschia seohaensis]SSA44606.1 protein of unknown function [Jannaschia seohaensis]